MIDQYRCPMCQRLLFKVEVTRGLFGTPDVKVIYRAEGLKEYLNPKTDMREVVCTKCPTVSVISNKKLIEVGKAKLQEVSV